MMAVVGMRRIPIERSAPKGLFWMKRREGPLSRATLVARRSSAMIPARAGGERAHDSFSRRPVVGESRAITRARANVSVFLDPELIHAGKRVRPFGLERVPAIEIAHETVAAESLPITLHHLGGEFKTDEFQAVLDEEGLDLRDRQPALLDVK